MESTALVEQKPLTTQFYLLLITAIVEQKIQVFSENLDANLSKVGILKLIKL